MILVLLLLAGFAGAQDPPFVFHAQLTAITQYHGKFDSPYTGLNSLRDARETKTSLTSTLFFTFRHKRTELEFDPELAGGKGFSGVTGIAGFPNGEIPRVGKPTPTPYIARLYLKQSWTRFKWIFGKMSAG